MERFTRLVALIALGSLLVGGEARADAIGPPPPNCPEGSAPIQCHGPPTCAVSPCADDGECGRGKVCRERALCTRQNCCRGGWAGCHAPGEYTTHASVACGADGACPEEGTSCTTARVCVPDGTTAPAPAPSPRPGSGAPPPAPDPSSRGGGCSAAGPRSARGAAPFLALLALALPLSARRRRGNGATYDRFLRFKRVVRDACGPSSTQYRRIHGRSVEKLEENEGGPTS